tara:strand:+ start:1627 stop:1854 length:228 start_codon:yes stop_codon:yes gene_type:complete
MKFIEFDGEIIRADLITLVTKPEGYPMDGDDADYYTWRIYNEGHLVWEFFADKESSFQKRDELKQLLFSFNKEEL